MDEPPIQNGNGNAALMAQLLKVMGGSNRGNAGEGIPSGKSPMGTSAKGMSNRSDTEQLVRALMSGMGSQLDTDRVKTSSGGMAGFAKGCVIKTGGVKNGNGGGFKKGGSTKKAYATGGTVDSGKPVAMPKKPMSRPVANSMQSGTFAKGGKVDFYSDLAKKLQKNPEKPNLRLIKTHTGPKGHVAKVYKDRDYGEYRTKFYSPEGKHLTEGDSHTDDSEDAHMTAKHEVNRGYKRGGKA
jgi:hypothetical protein